LAGVGYRRRHPRLARSVDDAITRATTAVESEDEDELAGLLDKVAALGAAFLEHKPRIVEIFSAIYSLPLGPHDDRRFGMSTGISPEGAPRIFLAVIERIYAERRTRLAAPEVKRRRYEPLASL